MTPAGGSQRVSMVSLVRRVVFFSLTRALIPVCKCAESVSAHARFALGKPVRCFNTSCCCCCRFGRAFCPLLSFGHPSLLLFRSCVLFFSFPAFPSFLPSAKAVITRPSSRGRSMYTPLYFRVFPYIRYTRALNVQVLTMQFSIPQRSSPVVTADCLERYTSDSTERKKKSVCFT